MPNNGQQQSPVTNELLKWGFMVVVFLIGSGLVGLANRDVYSKEQVDEKIEHTNDMQRLYNENIQRQLTRIEAMVKDTNAAVQEQQKAGR